MSRFPDTALPNEQDFLLSAYGYELPQSQIAQAPAAQRDQARLMVLNRASNSIEHARFSDITRFLPPCSLLIANNVQVTPARLYGQRPGGGKAEFLLLTPLAEIRPTEPAGQSLSAPVQGLARPAARLHPNEAISFAPGFSFQIAEIGDFGQVRGHLHWSGDLAELLSAHGHWPLPPYIRRPDSPEDACRYQTTYADPRRAGAVAAPTAGLHFTP